MLEPGSSGTGFLNRRPSVASVIVRRDGVALLRGRNFACPLARVYAFMIAKFPRSSGEPRSRLARRWLTPSTRHPGRIDGCEERTEKTHRSLVEAKPIGASGQPHGTFGVANVEAQIIPVRSER
jgi:hypothetical protein